MGFEYTKEQKRVMEARDRNILVSAAAGSGKTAVLVERIVRMISEGDHPLDIDRLLVVTFTRAAAAQMRERIAQAIEKRLEEDPGNAHLVRQETLLHNAQITTIDSFCSFLVRNNFSEIGLDPGTRLADETEEKLLEADVLEKFLEGCYEEKDPAFLACADYFCPGGDDRELASMISDLSSRASSRPMPEDWLRERREDYVILDQMDLFGTPWMQTAILDMLEELLDLADFYGVILEICSLPGGPGERTESILTAEREGILAPLRDPAVAFAAAGDRRRISTLAGYMAPEDAQMVYTAVRKASSISFERFSKPGKRQAPDLDPDRWDLIKGMRGAAKDAVGRISSRLASSSPDLVLAMMEKAAGPVRTLVDLTLAYRETLAREKKDRGVMDFSDLEHYALQILTEKGPDGEIRVRPAALEYRRYFDEILIDEYQDSNDVQELLLRTISREDTAEPGNRFMVGDVKQSIYRFRLARPEIFMDKLRYYKQGDPVNERIDLDKNFRSRKEVLEGVNAVFERIMVPEVGGVLYDEEASLKHGMPYPEGGDDYRPELLLVNGTPEEETEEEEEEVPPGKAGPRQAEALAVAARIREMHGSFRVRDRETGELRPCRYSDMVILLRTAAGWSEEFREVLEKQDIPVHVEARSGYFQAREVRELLQLLRVMDNPRQDIPLYGALSGYFGGMSLEELARVRADHPEGPFHEAVMAALEGEEPDRKLAGFMAFLEKWRERSLFLPVPSLLHQICEETGYYAYTAALPRGGQRLANLRFLETQAQTFEKTSYTGLFQFLRYIDQIHKREVDFGEASMLDENADVVRIMTIHKSKGLEFPICFVSGLAKKYNMRDASGDCICDTDWGLGVSYLDGEKRVRAETFRSACVADKIRRDALGEEIRVLYVAMTRAMEKLILTGYVRDAGDCLAGQEALIRGYREMGFLPVSLIRRSGTYLQLVLRALLMDREAEDLLDQEADGPFRVRVRDTSDALLQELRDQEALSLRAVLLDGLAGKGEEDWTDKEAVRELERSLSFAYPHADLAGLYVRTSVSAVKNRAREEEMSAAGREGGPGEGAHELFPEKEPVPCLPDFMKEPGEGGPSGTGYGSAVHRVLELMDYDRFGDGRGSLEDLEAFIRSLEESGKMEPSFEGLVRAEGIRDFLESPLGRRMARAARKGLLHRESPFVLGVPASDLDPAFPSSETIMVQGIIDAWFEEDGRVVIVDYKTDRVSSGEELIKRYRAQLVYYGRALRQILHKEVSEYMFYSFALRSEVRL